MKNKILVLAILGFAAGVVLVGCQKTGKTSNEDSKGSMGEAEPDSQAVRAGYSDEWQKFKTESEIRIQNNENSIAAFKVKMDKSGTRMKAKFNEEIARLEKANRGMKKKLEEYKNDGGGAWANFKTGFNNEMDKLGKALKKLTSDND